MDNSNNCQSLIDLHLRFFKFVCYWDLHKMGNLQAPHSEYALLRKELIDAILLLDKSEKSKTFKALRSSAGTD